MGFVIETIDEKKWDLKMKRNWKTSCFCYNGFEILVVVLVIRGYEMVYIRTLASDVLAHDLDW